VKLKFLDLERITLLAGESNFASAWVKCVISTDVVLYHLSMGKWDFAVVMKRHMPKFINIPRGRHQMTEETPRSRTDGVVVYEVHIAPWNNGQI
jgi:hypothetical protein